MQDSFAEAQQAYRDAQKKAQKEYKTCLGKGEYPYLPVLDDILQEKEAYSKIEIGLIQVPLEFVVGTKTAGRTAAFARNFMPLLEPSSEMSLKWMSLCEAHLKEGIRDPIKVYEYFNRYYVEEGNKRVSVLKFFDAVNVPATVTRILPPKSEDPEIELYYEFVDFYQHSGLNEIEFSKKGSYAELQKVMKKEPEEDWTEDERASFKSLYYRFRQEYEALDGEKYTSLKAADALLIALKILGFESLYEKSVKEMKRALSLMKKELTLQAEEGPIGLKLEPLAVTDKVNRITKIFERYIKPEKVAFVHDKRPEVSSWVNGHEKARLHLEEAYHDFIRTTAYFCSDYESADEAIKQAMEDGNILIFTTRPILLPASLKAAVENPNVMIFNCSLNKAHYNLPTYHARMYEVKFILGAIAGALSIDGKIGYVSYLPLFGDVAGINAFALGAKMTNPKAQIYLDWSSVDNLVEAVCRLVEQGITLFSLQDASVEEDSTERPNTGLIQIAEGESIRLASAVWHWDVYYENILKELNKHSLRSDQSEKDKAINFYWGMGAGVVDVAYSDNLPKETKRLADILKHAVCSGELEPFEGIFSDEEENPMTIEKIIEMDYLVDNVIGKIPKAEEINEEHRETVELMGAAETGKEKTE